MSKVIILGDVHIGVRSASQVVADYQLKYYEDHVFPYMMVNGIDTIVQMGDLFDTRKYTNHVVLDMWRERFFDVMQDQGIKFKMILGNHDIALKNTLEVNTPSLFLGDYDNIEIFSKPTDIDVDGMSILMMPWICSDNHEDCNKALSESNSLWCLGHFEIEGFETVRGHVHVGGNKMEHFKRFERVLSGHFHTRSENKNIRYVGTPYQMNWGDYGEEKGFHVLNTEDRTLEYVNNPTSLFKKVYYDDKGQEEDYYKSIDLSGITDCYVKVLVVNNTNAYFFEKFLERLYNQIPFDVKIVENVSEFEDEYVDVDNDVIKMEDTQTLIDSYIDSVDTHLDLTKLKTIMNNLYVDALEIVD